MNIEKEDHIRKKIQKLQIDDLVQINFVDASKTTYVHNPPHQLSNKAFARYKQIVGRFWCVMNDRIYGVEHLILRHAIDENVIWSVPVPMIADVKRLASARLTEVSDVGYSVLTGKFVKIIERDEGIGNEWTK